MGRKRGQMNPLTAIDFYKADHRRQYPKGTSLVYSNFTARSSNLKNIPDSLFLGGTIFFGLQHFVKSYLIDMWNEGFFKRPKNEVVDEYKRRMDYALGPGAIPVEHIEALHDLGYLPICIEALPEGTFTPIRVPSLVIYNTHPDFFWLTNYLETVLSNSLWKPIISATTAFHYQYLLRKYAKDTGSDQGFVQFQGHDFSARGMSGIHDAALSGAAHLTSFVGTDTVNAIDLVEDYYGANVEKELVGCSVPASEHSVMAMGTKESELDTYRRFITQIYPSGIVSIVSDTWDFWKVLSEFTVQLKPEILARNGKVVFRPDSGDPVKIICGDYEAAAHTPAYKGAVEILWDIFGGTVNEMGYKVLDPHVGLIYGDSITPERAQRILQGLKDKGFAASNIVFGIGSFTYNYTTRDTYGMAVKSTFGIVNGQNRNIFKDPATDSGKMKKSAVGLIYVHREGGVGRLTYTDNHNDIDDIGALETVFLNGKLVREQTLEDIRSKVRAEIEEFIDTKDNNKLNASVGA